MKKVSLQEKVEVLEAAFNAGLDYEVHLQGQLAYAKSELDYGKQTWANDKKYLEDRLASNERSFTNSLNEKNTRIAQLGEEVAQLKEKINVANEMKNITLELTRRFTSIQVTSLGTQTAPHTPVIGENAPHALRAVK